MFVGLGCKAFGRRMAWMTAHLFKHNGLSFPEYAQLFPVSMKTYRRDLALLNEWGIITRPVADHGQGRVVFVEAQEV